MTVHAHVHARMLVMFRLHLSDRKLEQKNRRISSETEVRPHQRVGTERRTGCCGCTVGPGAPGLHVHSTLLLALLMRNMMGICLEADGFRLEELARAEALAPPLPELRRCERVERERSRRGEAGAEPRRGIDIRLLE